MAQLTTHVLDTMNGCPAAGMQVTLYRLEGDDAVLLREVTLDVRPDALVISVAAGVDTQTIEELLPPGRFDDDAYLPVVAARLEDGSRVLVAAVVDQPGALYEAAEYLFESLPLALLLALALGAHTGYAILRRMDAVGRTAGEIMRGDLSRRVPLEGRDDEFDMLGRNINAMLDRISTLMDAIRGVTDNIAHDLRLPLSRLRGRLEASLADRNQPAQLESAIEQSIDDVARDLSGLLEASTAALRAATPRPRDPAARR